MTKCMPNCNGFVCEKTAPHCVHVRFWVWTFAALFFDCCRSSLMRAVNVRVTSKHPFLSQSDRIGDKLSVVQTRSLLIARGLFVSEQYTDTVSTFPPVYSRRAKRCCFCGAIENYSVTLFNGHKNSIFLESQAVEATLATWVEQHRSDSYPACLFASLSLTASWQICCWAGILLYCGKVPHRTAHRSVLLFIFSSFHIYFNYLQIILVPFCTLSYLSSLLIFLNFILALAFYVCFLLLYLFFCPPRRKPQMLHTWWSHLCFIEASVVSHKGLDEIKIVPGEIDFHFEDIT